MVNALVRIQKNKNITLPVWAIQRFKAKAGDYIRIEETEEGILMRPACVVDPSQAYFWTKEWQVGEREVERDIRKGRVKAAKSIRDLMADLRRP